MKLCHDNFSNCLDTQSPHAVRWAIQEDRFKNPRWTKWHYSEGDSCKTACGRVIIPFGVDDSPQEQSTDKINCKICLKRSAINEST